MFDFSFADVGLLVLCCIFCVLWQRARARLEVVEEVLRKIVTDKKARDAVIEQYEAVRAAFERRQKGV